MTIILKENNEAIRNKIREAGIDVCCCAKFYDADWLDYHPSITKSVHGVGYPYEGMTKEQTLALYLEECKDAVYCKDVDEFIYRIKCEERKIILSHVHNTIGWLEDHKQHAASGDIEYIEKEIEWLRSLIPPVVHAEENGNN